MASKRAGGTLSRGAAGAPRPSTDGYATSAACTSKDPQTFPKGLPEARRAGCPRRKKKGDPNELDANLEPTRSGNPAADDCPEEAAAHRGGAPGGAARRARRRASGVRDTRTSRFRVHRHDG